MPDAAPIDTRELLATIGELYVQVRTLQRIVAEQQLRAQPTMQVNGINGNALPIER